MLEIERRLEYGFRDPSLLEEALTHPSYGIDRGVPHYQRLEFLGDAVLQLSVTARLYALSRDLDEGRLTRARAAIVCERSLAGAAAALGLGAALRLSVGEERSGGRGKPSILADALEAVFGAIYLDGGQAEADRAIGLALADALESGAEAGGEDYKSRLQVRLQRDRDSDPTYELVGSKGPPHKPTFAVRITLGGEVLGEGEGGSKQSAGQAAARDALSKLPPDAGA